MGYITVTAEAEVHSRDVIKQISDKELIEEIRERDISISDVQLSFEDWELIEMICANKSIIEADKIKDFFKKP